MAKDWKRFEDEDLEDEQSELENQEVAEDIQSLEHPSYEALEADLTKAEQRAEKAEGDALRAKAEIENVKRRFTKELEDAHKYSIKKFAEAILPVVDSVEMSLNTVKSSNADDITKIVEGLELTVKIMLDALKKFGVEQVDPVGEVFNPAVHEAMSMVPSKEVPANHVVQVLQKGYLLHGRLIRPALVIVAAA